MSAIGEPSVAPRSRKSPDVLEGIPGAASLPTATISHPARTGDQLLRPPPERLALTRRAHQVMRIHLVRSAIRVTVLLAGDAAALLLLRALVRGVRDEQWLGIATAAVVSRLVPQGALPLLQLLPAVLLGLIVLDTYGASDQRRDTGRIVAGATLGLALPFWGYLWSHFSALVLPGFVVLAAIIGMTLILERHLIDYAVRQIWPIGPGAARAILIARPEDTLRGLEYPVLADPREFLVGATFDPRELQPSRGRAGFNKLCHTIKQLRADTLVLAGPLEDEGFAVLMEAAGAAGCQLYALPRSYALGGLEFETVWRRGVPLVALNRPGLRGRQLLLKRLLDIVLSCIGFLLLGPILVLIAAAIRLSSSGPILFRQTRVGLGGKPFTIAKFRSMVNDAEARRTNLEQDSLYADGRLFKVKDDPRITRMGNFLRRTSLDELPQLWNVFRGDMSLVGPRPPLPTEVDLYEDHHYTRFDVKPGITGPWQVSGRNTITDFEEVIRLETSYIRGWTIWKDFGILLKTVPAVLFMRGAQ
jgi:exopolysaccharide biosynthesis polyprenyl glycosylphosphotransferase